MQEKTRKIIAIIALVFMGVFVIGLVVSLATGGSLVGLIPDPDGTIKRLFGNDEQKYRLQWIGETNPLAGIFWIITIVAGAIGICLWLVIFLDNKKNSP